MLTSISKAPKKCDHPKIARFWPVTGTREPEAESPERPWPAGAVDHVPAGGPRRVSIPRHPEPWQYRRFQHRQGRLTNTSLQHRRVS